MTPRPMAPTQVLGLCVLCFGLTVAMTAALVIAAPAHTAARVAGHPALAAFGGWQPLTRLSFC